MAETNADTMKQLERLEDKIVETVEKLTDLNSRCHTLQRVNDGLREELENMTERNNDLSEQIDQLRAAHDADEGTNTEDIIRRIDRMLEKFGELQI